MTRRVIGVGLTLAVIVAAIAAPWLAPHDPARTDFARGLRPPGTPGHPLGTDQLGRDLLARVLYGARLALFIGVCTVVATAVVGGVLGLVTGFVERWPSAVIMRLADVQLSFPFILLAMTINVIVGLGLRNIILSLSVAGWVVYARVVRGEVLSVKQRDFVHAAAALGAGRARLLFRHVLPNVAPTIVVVASLQFSQFVVAEAGVDPAKLQLTLDTPSGRYPLDKNVSLAIAAQLQRLGIKVNVVVNEWGTHLDKVKNRTTGDMFFLGWGPAIFGQTVMEPLFKADQTYASYGNNKLVDEKVARAITIVDARGRAAAYAELQKLIHDEAPWVFLWQQHDLYGIANHAEWAPRADEKVWMYDAKVLAR